MITHLTRLSGCIPLLLRIDLRRIKNASNSPHSKNNYAPQIRTQMTTPAKNVKTKFRIRALRPIKMAVWPSMEVSALQFIKLS